MAVNVLRDLVAGAIVLGVLVLVHEWGHFIVAKWCGVKVEVFSIGFGPRLFGWKRGDTDYRISIFPLGGYVRMAGENPVEERPGEPYEFLSRPRWQRFLIAIAGPAMNVILAIAVFWGIYALVGMPMDAYVKQPATVAAIPRDHEASLAIRPGDRIVELAGVATPTWSKVMAQLQKAKPESSVPVTVLRNGSRDTFEITIPAKQTALEDLLGFPMIPPVIDNVGPGFPAQKAGLQAGDRIVSMDGHPIVTWPQLVEGVTSAGPHPIHFTVNRHGKDIPLTITPVQSMNSDGNTTWMIGAQRQVPQFYEKQGVVESVGNAAAQTWSLTRLEGDLAAGLVKGSVSTRDLAGPIGIVQMSGEAAQGGMVTLLTWTAYISLDLALINLLPIPILDGGQVLILAVEGTLRRDLSMAMRERFVQVGLVFILCLFALAFYSDIHRLIGY